jgi:hypothetical protein
MIDAGATKKAIEAKFPQVVINAVSAEAMLDEGYADGGMMAKGGVIASSTSKEGIEKLIGDYYYSKNISIQKIDNKDEYEVSNSKGKINGVKVVVKKGRYQFVNSDKMDFGGMMAKGGMTGVSIKGTGISAAELIKIISNPKVESILVPSGILGYVIVDKKAMIDKLYKLYNLTGSVRLVFDYDMAKDMNWIYIDTKKELNS